jgi:hypothetical protein
MGEGGAKNGTVCRYCELESLVRGVLLKADMASPLPHYHLSSSLDANAMTTGMIVLEMLLKSECNSSGVLLRELVNNERPLKRASIC